MAEAAKVIKVNGGEAFIEIGETYIRIGVGSEVFLVLDKETINGGAQNVNWQMGPSKMTYQGLLSHVDTVPGLSPVGPKYTLNRDALRSITNVLRAISSISGAVGI